MREILFRGKEVESGDWYYGDIFHSSVDVDTVRIHDYRNRANVKIIPETLGQFTGLTDKNGVKIFEGDIVEYETGKKVRIGRVFFSDFRSSFSVTAGKNGSARINNDLYNYIQNRNSVIVIGNIYDNPELIGGEEQ